MLARGKSLLVVAVLAGLALVPDNALGQEETVLEAGASVSSLAFSPDGKYLAAGLIGPGNENHVLVWDLAKGKKFKSLKPHSRHVVGLAWLPDSVTLMAINFAGPESPCILTPWNVISGNAGQKRELADVGFFRGLSHDGKFLVTGYEGKRKLANVWDLETGKKVASLEVSVEDCHHSHTVFSADGKTLVTGNSIGLVKVWQVPAFKEKASITLDDTLRHLCVSPSGEVIATYCQPMFGGAQSQLWDLRGKKPTSLELIPRDVPFAFAPDGKTLATVLGAGLPKPSDPAEKAEWLAAIENGRTQLWDVGAGRLVAHMLYKQPPTGSAMLFSPDGRTLVIDRDDTTLLLLQVAHFKKIKPPK